MSISRGFYKTTLLTGLAATCCVLLPFHADAAGFAIKEQSASKLGNAFAGAGSEANDLSVMFFNPAGITRIKGSQALASASIIIPKVEFTNTNSRAPGGGVATGTDQTDAGVVAYVPSAYAAWDMNEDTKMGFSVNAPFGLKTEYNEDFVGRYQGLRSEMRTITAGPNIAHKVTDKLSIGARAHAQYIDVNLTQALPLNTLSAGAVQDGTAKIEGDAMDLGYALGLLYEPTAATRFGLSYQSEIKHTLRGNARFINNGFTPGGNFTDTTVTGRFISPQSILLSSYHDVNDKLAVMADVQWTGWSTFNELRIDFDSAQADTVVTTNWNDAFFYSAGVNYKQTQDLMLRAGIAYDQSPAQPKFATPRIPDSDRYWIAAGGSYQYSQDMTIDFGYTHIFVQERTINKLTESASVVDRVVGTYDTNIDIFTIQANLKF